MKRRCLNTNAPNYKNYGGRGIRVCPRWLGSFDNFLADMGRAPEGKRISIDRIDNDGNYEPSNCIWATTTTQNRNKSTTKLDKDSVKEMRRLHAMGWSTKELAEKYNISHASASLAANYKTWTKEMD